MPVTEFEADCYEPVINNQPGEAMTLHALQSPLRDDSRETQPTGNNQQNRLSQREGAEKRRKRETIIGANCLSIIGLIEPGRTVRLYRQIH